MPAWIIYCIAVIEGFSTLAVEIIVLRQAAPIVGSSSILTSIFLGIILLALSAGYYSGGLLAERLSTKKAIIQRLGWYLSGSGLRYLFITFPAQQPSMQWLLESTNNYTLSLFVTGFVLFFLPVYIASQTIPLLTELLHESSSGKATGKILFASTIGSFLGSVGTSIVLFEWLGVSLTSIVVGCSLLIATSIFRRTHNKKASILIIIATMFIARGLVRQHQIDPDIIYSFDSSYQHIEVKQSTIKEQEVRLFLANNAYASALFVESMESPFSYIQEVVDITKQETPARILVIGTAGFTYPQQIANFPFVQHIDAIDVDPNVFHIAETYFLQEPLSTKITFHPLSARYVVRDAIARGINYDLIFLDAYQGKSLPGELITQEFFKDLEQIRAPAGNIIANIILDNKQESLLAQHLYATWHNVFGTAWSKNVSANTTNPHDNIIVSTHNHGQGYTVPTRPEHTSLYTDDKRSSEQDSVRMYR